MGATKYQYLTTHTRKKENHHHNKRKDHHHKIPKKSRKDPFNIRCYTYDENGTYSKDFPRNKDSFNKKSNKKTHHAHTVKDDEPTIKDL